MKLNLILPFVFVLFLAPEVFGQEVYFAGFEHALSGTSFTYNSQFTYREKCMLVRARSEFDPIEWETEVIPETYAEKTLSFIWYYGISTSSPEQEFDLYINGQKLLTFTNPTNNQPTRKIEAENGAALTFNRSMVDKNNDEMGSAVLTIPRKYFTPGKPALIKVDGVDNESNTWYMTYERQLKWRYQLTSSSDPSNSFATRFGWDNRVPMLARVIPPGTSNSAEKAFSLSLMDLDLPNLLLVNARPSSSGSGVILHLRARRRITSPFDAAFFPPYFVARSVT